MNLYCSGRLLLLAVTGLSVLLTAGSGMADVAPDAAGDRVIEEILVTARRREEASIAVPMSLTRIDGASIDGLQYHELDQFLSLSPGVLVYTGGDGVSSQITIRGVVTPGAMVEPGNAVYVDEMYVSGMRTILPGFYDIQSVQVLKGPQAGLYGRNTTGGAVLITTGQATGELSARIDASYAQYDTRETSATINLPVSEVLRLRATGWYQDSDGGYYQDKILDENLDATHQTGGRLTFAVLPNDRAALTVSAEYVDIDENGFANFSGMVKDARLAAPPLAPEHRRNVLRDDAGGTDQNSARVNGKVEVDTDTGALVALAGWRRITVRQPDSDFDGSAYSASASDPSTALSTPAPQIFTLDDRDTSRQAEVRYLTPDSGDPVSAVLGVSYYEETLRYRDATMPVRDFALALAAFGLDGSWEHRADLETRSWAGYGELLWTPVATIEVTADLRYTRDRKDIDSSQTASGLYSSFVGLPNISLDTSNTFDNWSPGITLAYKPDDALTLFAKYVRGFRAGGFNTLAYDPALLPYASEEAENYELGGKTLLLDRRVELGASVFYLRIDNALVPQRDPGVEQDLWPLQNSGVAETTGMEVDLSAGVATGLTLAASAGAYQYDLNGFSILDRRPFAPDYTASLVADYQRPFTSAITGVARLGFRHRSGGRLPFGYGIDMDDYNLLDAQFGLRVGNAEFAAFVRNALDDHYRIGNYSVGVVQTRFVSASGLDPDTTRSVVRNPGSVFGIRLTLTL